MCARGAGLRSVHIRAGRPGPARPNNACQQPRAERPEAGAGGGAAKAGGTAGAARHGTHVLRVPLVDGGQRGASGHLVGRGAAPGALGKAARCRRPRPGGGGRPLSPPAAGRSGRAAGLLPAPLGARRHGLARRAAARLAAAGLRAARPPAPPPPPSCPLR